MAAIDRLSIQLYSLRAMGGLERQLDAVVASGLKLVETVQSQYDTALETRRALDARGLKAPSGHVALGALRERFDTVVAAAQELRAELLIVPALPAEERVMGAAGWERVGHELAGYARRLRERGLAFAYHNHAWELEPLADGRLPLDVLLDAADGVGWQADVAWLARGGASVDGWLERRGERIVSIHVKDIAAPGQNLDEDGWCDVGAGELGWAELWPRCGATAARQLVLEHDKPRDGATFMADSAAFLRGLRS